MDSRLIERIVQRVAADEASLLRFLREIVAIPSIDGDIAQVGERVRAEMRHLGFDQVYVDRYGSTVGRIGDGPITLLYDSHLDTVGVGDRAQWQWDPFEGKVEDGKLYARGALDEKGSTPGMIYGMRLARDLGLLDDFSVYYFGNIEEWCDGVACKAFVEWEQIVPDFVVIGEPTDMQIYRGQKGRVELEVVAKGKGAHAASSHLGDNAIYKMLPVIERIMQLEETLPIDPFLGKGSLTVTRINSVAASDNAVPEECRIFLDRRTTFGESTADIVAAVRALLPDSGDFRVEELVWQQPSYTGAIMQYDRTFPAWALAADDPFVQAARRTLATLWPQREPFGKGKWEFSTNGNYWNGRLGIPSIGFGPGEERLAHTIEEHVPLADVVSATCFYALLPYFLAQIKAD